MQQKSRFVLLAQRILLLLALYTFCRLLFLIFNFGYFKENSFTSVLKLFFFGLRFDITAIVISNIPFLVLSVVPLAFLYHRTYQWILKFFFILVNSFAMLFNCIDFEAFQFQGKRMTTETFRIMSFGEDFVNTVPGMIKSFWYVLLIFCFLILLMNRAYKSIPSSKPPNTGRTDGHLLQSTWWQIGGFLIAFALGFIGFRGGMQYRPINIMTASQYASGKDMALVLNTPFTILKTLGKNILEPLNYFPAEEAEKISPVIHDPIDSHPFRPLNVVLIIVESLGKEYIGSMNSYEGYAPFIDSLSKNSLIFTQAFANGKRSIEGIPCVIAGLPAMMAEPFITSAYNGNKVASLASILKSKGYQSLFFHGGTNGTMGFDNFSKIAGYDYYYGRHEYNNDNDFDDNWGIYDEPFLQFASQKINEIKSPFFATIFTLSSHHPYSIPSKHKGQFKKGTLPVHESIQYADYSLKKFFETISKMPWYDSTLFVITADHTALSEHPFYQNHVGLYSIPIIFYMPHDSLKGKEDVTIQQADIIPSVLNYLHYDKKYFSFGTSVFDSTRDHFAVNSLNDSYQIISGNYAFTMDTSKAQSLYNYRNDSLLNKNLLDSFPEEGKKLERKLKAFLQNYNSAILNNSMSVQ